MLRPWFLSNASELRSWVFQRLFRVASARITITYYLKYETIIFLNIIKNTLLLKLNTDIRKISNIQVPTTHKKLKQSTYLNIAILGPIMYNTLPLKIKHSNFTFLRFLQENYTLATTRNKYL